MSLKCVFMLNSHLVSIPSRKCVPKDNCGKQTQKKEGTQSKQIHKKIQMHRNVFAGHTYLCCEAMWQRRPQIYMAEMVLCQPATYPVWTTQMMICSQTCYQTNMTHSHLCSPWDVGHTAKYQAKQSVALHIKLKRKDKKGILMGRQQSWY